MPSRKIKVSTSCVANGHAEPNEKIIEFSSPNGGGLISFQLKDDGTLNVSVYNTDATVMVQTPKAAGQPARETLCKCCVDNECWCEGAKLMIGVR